MAFLLPLVSIPGKDLFDLPIFHFLKVYIGSPRGFHFGISDMCISSSDQNNSSITYSIVLLPYLPIAYNCVILTSFIDAILQNLSLS
jgi:hypothetical protein